jgi:putative ABC transport system substrate-binding protein
MVPSTPRVSKVAVVVATYDGNPSAFDLVWSPLFAEHGFVQGSNLSLTPVRLHDLPDPQRAQAAQKLVDSRPDVIVVSGTPMSHLFKKLTREIPIVFTAGDPVAVGLVESLSRPGGNLTGIANLAANLDSKRLELLRELRPSIKRAALLMPRQERRTYPFELVAATSSQLGMELVEIVSEPDVGPDAVAQLLRAARVDGAIVLMSPALVTNPQLHAHLLQLSLPAVFPYPDAVDHGGLIYYGVDVQALNKRLVALVARVLNGERPATIPVEQPSKYSLAVNLSTARALVMAIPYSVRIRADRVVE